MELALSPYSGAALDSLKRSRSFFSATLHIECFPPWRVCQSADSDFSVRGIPQSQGPVSRVACGGLARECGLPKGAFQMEFEGDLQPPEQVGKLLLTLKGQKELE